MTDPIYGDSPIDIDQRWWESMRPPLVNDPEIVAWQAVIKGVFGEIAASAWLVRWRTKSVYTALGVHLDAKGRDLNFIRPDSWDDDRYSSALIPIEGAAFGIRPPSATAALAEGLVTGTQAWEMITADPLTYVVVFYELTVDESLTYFTVLNLARPRGVRFVLVYSPEAKADVFVLDDSLLDGPDILALSLFSED